jgi:stage III sporulation protein AD
VEIVRIVGLGLVSAVLLTVVRKQKPEIAVVLSMVAGVLIVLTVVGRLFQVVAVFQELGDRANLPVPYMGTVLKVIGIAYIADFGAQVLDDAGEKAVASKVEMAGKVLIVVLAVPVVLGILDAVLGLVK